MSWLSIHVKGLRTRIGMTKAQMAQRINVGETTIENIESGYLAAPPSELVEKIAAVFGVSAQSLYSSAPVELAMEPAKEVYVIKEVDPDFKLPSWDDVSDVIYVDSDALRGYDHIAVQIHDDSMILEGIRKNSIALVRTNSPLKNNDFVLALHDKKTIVRKYFNDGKKILLRAASGSGDYPDITLDAEKDKANIIGKVIRWEFNV